MPMFQPTPYGQIWQPDDAHLYALPEEAILPSPATAFVDPTGSAPPVPELPPPPIGGTLGIPSNVAPPPEVLEPPPAPPVTPWGLGRPAEEPAPPPAQVAPEVAVPPPAGAPATAPGQVEKPAYKPPAGSYEFNVGGAPVYFDASGELLADQELAPATKDALLKPGVLRGLVDSVGIKEKDRGVDLANKQLEIKQRVDDQAAAQTRANMADAQRVVDKKQQLVDAATMRETDAIKKGADFEMGQPETPAWRKALALVAIALSGIAQTRNGGPNVAFEMLMRMTEEQAKERARTYAKLQSDIEGAHGAVANAQDIRDKTAAEQFRRAAIGQETVARMFEKAALTTKTEQARAEANAKAAEARSKSLENAAAAGLAVAEFDEKVAKRKADAEQAAKELAERTRAAKAGEATARFNAQTGRLGYKLDVLQEQNAERNRAWEREHPDPSKALAFATTPAEIQGRQVVDLFASDADKKAGKAYFLQPDGKTPILLDDATNKKVKPKISAGIEVANTVADIKRLLKNHSLFDKGISSIPLIGARTTVERDIKARMSDLKTSYQRLRDMGTMDVQGERIAEDWAGGDPTDILADSSSLDKALDSVENFVNADLQATGMFTHLDRPWRIPRFVAKEAPVDKNVDTVFSRGALRKPEWKKRQDEIRSVLGADPTETDEERSASYAVNSALEKLTDEDLLRAAREGETNPEVRKAAERVAWGRMRDQWALPADKRSGLIEKMMSEKWVQKRKPEQESDLRRWIERISKPK